MENRYDGLLIEYNQEILGLHPSSIPMWNMLAHEIAKVHVFKTSFIYGIAFDVLEIGAGEGDATLPVLEKTSAGIRVLDISEEMISRCKERFKNHPKKHCLSFGFGSSDAFSYLRWANENNQRNSIVYASQVVHNFKQEDKKRLFRAVWANLSPGGTFLLYDKIYPDEGWEKLLEAQQRRYEYLPPHVCRAIQEHELEDASDEYRMHETETFTHLKAAGFSSVRIIDRIERDLLIIATK